MAQQVQQLTLNLVTSENSGNGEFMLWYEDTGAEPEEAIKNAGRYYYQKYGTRPTTEDFKRLLTTPFLPSDLL